MSKESMAATACNGCGLSIYYNEYHERHCDKTQAAKPEEKRRRRKRNARKSSS